ncbi:TetR/AcrR family transcriptional regulator [Arthrobacter sp. CAN_C5]|uniref:TetR/AcrR family transcriptional regulator n=1 Tax=Arthrobacter sp. CAN_C5 TaxID=2760706 RepID=UPI001AE3126D|nr:TetR/AcrR family transcriptional regulator [Arthrobacter sp. CAN_C5]MBP2217038.1 TetR/AcrR family transcriptional repressor of nem operon [Arthrobacter sp. CAN_C5]
MGRTSDAPQNLMEAARTLMHDRGYSAIGVAEICDRADVRKGSFYYFFESKQALTVATLRATWALERARWVEILGRGTGLEGLEALIQEQVQGQYDRQRSSGSVVGCLYGNLAVETTTSEQDLRDCLREIFDDQSQLIFENLRRATLDGPLDDDKATIVNARALIAQPEGNVLLAKLYNDPALLGPLWAQITGLLGITAVASDA